jgi:hypothetical protein
MTRMEKWSSSPIGRSQKELVEIYQQIVRAVNGEAIRQAEEAKAWANFDKAVGISRG